MKKVVLEYWRYMQVQEIQISDKKSSPFILFQQFMGVSIISGD